MSCKTIIFYILFGGFRFPVCLTVTHAYSEMYFRTYSAGINLPAGTVGVRIPGVSPSRKGRDNPAMMMIQPSTILAVM
ncbi:hypothetical protein QBC37DRAFT_413373 [Rhypophila decipiens]|uniref:Uncharacterized protein n=1 Tax=Rhypophila decipiens TaxID=261697 RepID=A0AAN7BCC5_9PEZI|nr:hypothetical protein QBC37DRAFT_413373 [Rhypophila decipiens]